MNDFTKEELEATLNGLEQWVHPECDYTIYCHLRAKIQSMLDNYCEHETDQGGCGGDFRYLCKKCGEFYR
jgi:hypothetical protein